MSYVVEVERQRRQDRKDRWFHNGLHMATVAMVVVALLVFGTRQSDYHNEQTHANTQIEAQYAAQAQKVIATYQAGQKQTDTRITCEINTLDSILAELSAAQSAEMHHKQPPAYHYPKSC